MIPGISQANKPVASSTPDHEIIDSGNFVSHAGGKGRHFQNNIDSYKPHFETTFPSLVAIRKGLWVEVFMTSVHQFQRCHTGFQLATYQAFSMLFYQYLLGPMIPLPSLVDINI